DEESLRGAVAVYTGPLLEGCLEEWAFTERAARDEQCLAALETLAEGAAGRGEHGEAIPYLRRAEALDPLRDSLPRRLMTRLAAAGAWGRRGWRWRWRARRRESLPMGPPGWSSDRWWTTRSCCPRWRRRWASAMRAAPSTRRR